MVKKIIKFSFIMVFVLFIGVFLKKVYASDWDDPFYGKVKTKSETVKIIPLKGDISKKEVVNVLRYYYPDSLKSSGYRYIVWKSTITYFNSVTDQVFAFAEVESSFKYNKKNKTCECLSSNCGKVYENDSCMLSVFSRRKNEKLDMGGSFVDIKFRNKGISYEENDYCVKCDYLGNISLDD